MHRTEISDTTAFWIIWYSYGFFLVHLVFIFLYSICKGFEAGNHRLTYVHTYVDHFVSQGNNQPINYTNLFGNIVSKISCLFPVLTLHFAMHLTLDQILLANLYKPHSYSLLHFLYYSVPLQCIETANLCWRRTVYGNAFWNSYVVLVVGDLHLGFVGILLYYCFPFNSGSLW